MHTIHSYLSSVYGLKYYNNNGDVTKNRNNDVFLYFSGPRNGRGSTTCLLFCMATVYYWYRCTILATSCLLYTDTVPLI